jgi:hypothetical protein
MDVINLFRTPPAPKSHHVLRLLDAQDTEGVFQGLLMILKCGLHELYGSHGEVNIDTLGIEDVARLQEYFLSFSILLSISDTTTDILPTRGAVLREFASVLHTPHRSLRISFDYAHPSDHALGLGRP